MHGSPSNKANCQMHLWPTCCFNKCLISDHLASSSADCTCTWDFFWCNICQGRTKEGKARCSSSEMQSTVTQWQPWLSLYRRQGNHHHLQGILGSPCHYKQPVLVMSQDMCQLSPYGLLCPAPEAAVVSSTQCNLSSCIELDYLISIAAAFSSRTQSPASLLQERERDSTMTTSPVMALRIATRWWLISRRIKVGSESHAWSPEHT